MTTVEPTSTLIRSPRRPASSAPAIVLGAGIGGLVAARRLASHGVPVQVFEGGPRIAGMAATEVDPDGFSYDVGAHFITNRLAGVLGVAHDCRTVRRYGEVVLVDGRFRNYPFGLIGVPRYARAAVAAKVRHPDTPVRTAADWFRREYGRALADEVAIPLVEAWSGAPADQLSPAVGDKIPASVAQTIWLRMAAKLTRRAVAIGYCQEQPQSPAVYHVYPNHGVSTLCQALADELGDAVHLNSPVERIYVEDGAAVGVKVAGRDVPARMVVSTAPIHVLPKLVEGSDALEPYGRFRFRGMVMVNLKMEGTSLLEDTVVWLPRGFETFRLTEATQSMPWLAPPGKTLVLAEYGAQPGDPVWGTDDDALIEKALTELAEIVPDARRRFLSGRVLRQPLAYPIFLQDYEADRLRLRQHGTGVRDLLSVGRNGEFDHILMEDLYWRTIAKVDQWVAEGALVSR
jgi:protoporphyrinogen/coproporphyrinogen III oxidase